MINVTKTFLPPKEEYLKYLDQIWESNQIANGGKLWFELQAKLKKYLNSPDLILTANGTLPLQMALKVLAANGEVITTPFSYVATTAAIVWENCRPVFVDIHPEHLSIDESRIEAAITEKTTAILATHVFGNPCAVEEIEQIARRNNLRVIYDAAHCFGVEYSGKSIFSYGDLSTCSFHATKIFHTGEGGAVFCSNQELYDTLFQAHNFGHKGPIDFSGPGINAKMNELQAAMGLAVLPHMKKSIEERKMVIDLYCEGLDGLPIKTMQLRDRTAWNYSYFPVIFESEGHLLTTKKALNEAGVFPRRYFYPSLNTLNYVPGAKMEISESIASRILCLPVHQKLNTSVIHLILNILQNRR